MITHEETERPSVIPVTLLFSLVLVTMLLWGFAFFHLPQKSPDWVRRAQAVCFGTGESGLPDASGWMVLILGPATFLASLLVTFYSEIRLGARRVLESPLCRKIGYSLLVVVGIECAWVINRIMSATSVGPSWSTSVSLNALPVGYPRTKIKARDFKLMDQLGHSISLASEPGKVIFLTFAYAHCATVCPVLVKAGQNARAALPGVESAFFIITLDPWRDTASALADRAKEWNLSQHEYFLSGPVDEVNELSKVYNVAYVRDQKSGEIVHPALVFVISPKGELAYSFNNPSQRWLTDAANLLWAER